MSLLSIIKRNKIKTGLVILLFFNILFIHFYLPRIFIEPNNFFVQFFNKEPLKLSPDNLSLQYEEIEIITTDNFKLKAYKIYSNTIQNNGTIIFLHGVRAYKEHFLSASKMLADIGYNSMLIDLRGHGNSEGKYCTFGFYEKNDISLFVDEIMLDNKLSNNIGIWGQSLGGAIAIEALAIDKRIKFGIIESTFSDLKEITVEYIYRLTGINNKYFSSYLLGRMEAIGGFDVKQVQPKESMKKITQPILLVHGTKDNRINIKHARLNFENIKSDIKYLLPIENANHINVWKVGGVKYLNSVLSFIDEVK